MDCDEGSQNVNVSDDSTQMQKFPLINPVPSRWHTITPTHVCGECPRVHPYWRMHTNVIRSGLGNRNCDPSARTWKTARWFGAELMCRRIYWIHSYAFVDVIAWGREQCRLATGIDLGVYAHIVQSPRVTVAALIRWCLDRCATPLPDAIPSRSTPKSRVAGSSLGAGPLKRCDGLHTLNQNPMNTILTPLHPVFTFVLYAFRRGTKPQPWGERC